MWPNKSWGTTKSDQCGRVTICLVLLWKTHTTDRGGTYGPLLWSSVRLTARLGAWVSFCFRGFVLSGKL